MSFYVAAYDTEGVYPWWDKARRQKGFSYTPEHIAEFLNGVRAVADVHLQRGAPASFFLVAKMLELCGPELRAILDNPLFDIQCHTFTHPNLKELGDDKAALRYELGDAKKLIEDTFGREVNGLTAPGGYSDGFRGPSCRSGGDVGGRLPLRAQCWLGAKRDLPPPCSISLSGMPRMASPNSWRRLPMPGTTTSSPASRLPSTGRRSCPGPYPTEMPRDAQGVYQAYAPGIDYCTQQDLLYYMPIFHPWSIYRIDKQAAQIGLLLDHARQKMELTSCNHIYQHILQHPELA